MLAIEFTFPVNYITGQKIIEAMRDVAEDAFIGESCLEGGSEAYIIGENRGYLGVILKVDGSVFIHPDEYYSSVTIMSFNWEDPGSHILEPSNPFLGDIVESVTIITGCISIAIEIS